MLALLTLNFLTARIPLGLRSMLILLIPVLFCSHLGYWDWSIYFHHHKKGYFLKNHTSSCWSGFFGMVFFNDTETVDMLWLWENRVVFCVLVFRLQKFFVNGVLSIIIVVFEAFSPFSKVPTFVWTFTLVFFQFNPLYELDVG